MGKRFCFFLVQTLGILLIFRWENWTRTIRSGPWNKIEQKKFKTEKNETIPISVFLIFIRAFSETHPHGSFLGYPCHLCFGCIVFYYCCFMCLIFMRSYIQRKLWKEGLNWFHYGYVWDLQIRLLYGHTWI